MSERPSPSPVVVFRPGRLARFLADGAVQGTLAALALAAPIVSGQWLPWPGLPQLIGAGGLLVYVLGVIVGVVTLHRWAKARAGQAELHEDRVVVQQSWHETQTYYLTDLEAFDDARGDVVRLRARSRDGAGRDVLVPTLVERPRAVLLDALARAGVPRVEGASARSAPAPRARPLLAVRGDGGRLEALGCSGLLAATLLLLAAGGAASWAPGSSAFVLGVLAAVIGGAAGLAGIVCLGLAMSRVGRVWFHADRIEVDPLGSSSPHARRLVISWQEIAGWRAESPHHVRLVLYEGLLREAHGDPTVPTPTPEVRAAVEALLRERGVALLP